MTFFPPLSPRANRFPIGDPCPGCGDQLETLLRGGCGGAGKIQACMKCDALYRQEGGGIVSTGTERMVPMAGSAKEFKKFMKKQQRSRR